MDSFLCNGSFWSKLFLKYENLSSKKYSTDKSINFFVKSLLISVVSYIRLFY